MTSSTSCTEETKASSLIVFVQTLFSLKFIGKLRILTLNYQTQIYSSLLFIFSVKYYLSTLLPASHTYCTAEMAVTYLLSHRQINYVKSSNFSS
jgi:hypothetical protein